MNLRPYRENEAREIAELFQDTVHRFNIRDYTREQVIGKRQVSSSLFFLEVEFRSG